MIQRAYIAGPYTHPEKLGRINNVDMASTVACEVFRLGGYPVVPHLVGIEVEHIKTDPEYDWWMRATSRELKTCDAIVMCPGWKDSKGSREEYIQAVEERKVIFYYEKDTWQEKIPGFEWWIRSRDNA